MDQALTDTERKVAINTAIAHAEDGYPLSSVIHVCTHDVRHDAQKRREAFAIALVWGKEREYPIAESEA